jgi:hypothetical protein
MGKYNISSIVPSVSNPTTVLSTYDEWLNQAVKSTSDVQFQSLHITSNATIDGDFTVLGTTFESESTIVKYKTHMLVINDGEMGNGVFLNEAGIEVDRGMYENVRIVFRESDTTFRVGKLSSTQAIATREDRPIDKGFMIWNASDNMMKSTNNLANDVIISSPTASTSIGTGALVVTTGGSSFGGDVYVGGTFNLRGTSLSQSGPSMSTDINNAFLIQSHGDILLTAQSIGIPDATALALGSSAMLYSESNTSLFIATGSDGCVKFSNNREAVSKNSASTIFYGGVSVNKTIILGGSTDYGIQATNNDDRIRIQSRGNLRPTVCCIAGTAVTPATELRISGAADDRYISIGVDSGDNFFIRSSADGASPEISLCTMDNDQQMTLKADGSVDFFGNVNLHTVNADPGANSAISRTYVDTLTQKRTVRVLISQEIALNDCVAGFVGDGVTLVEHDRILLTNCLDSTSNGIWVVNSGGQPPTRPLDFATASDVSGCTIFVSEGTVNASNGYICTPSSSNIVDTDFLFFTKFTGLGLIDAGIGLQKVNNTLNVRTDNVSIEIFNDAIRLAASAVSTGLSGGSGAPLAVLPNLPHVVEVGKLSGGSEWNGKLIRTAYGGTGRTTFLQNSVLLGNSGGSLSDDARLTWDAVSAILTVDGNISTSGTISTQVLDQTSALSTFSVVNCSDIIVRHAETSTNGDIVTMYATFEIHSTNDHDYTVFDTDLPLKTSLFASPIENSHYCFTTAMSVATEAVGTTIVTNLENVTATAVPGTTRTRFSFTSNVNTSIHILKAHIRYNE